MTKFKSQGFGNTFKNARKGFRLVLKKRNEYKSSYCNCVFVLVLAYILKFSALEFCTLLFAIAIVIVSEMLNTAIGAELDGTICYHQTQEYANSDANKYIWHTEEQTRITI